MRIGKHRRRTTGVVRRKREDMKRITELLCAMVVVAAASMYVIPYVGGRRGMPLSLAGLPAQVAAILIGLLCVGVLLVLSVTVFARQKRGGRNVLMFVASLTILVTGCVGGILVGGKLFQAGFRQNIRSAISPEELRQIAGACHGTLVPNKIFPGPKKWSIWNESQDRAQWNALTASTALGKLDPSVMIINRADAVELWWGGALVGHWGVIIQVNGKMEPGDIADGIRTFMGD